MRKCLSLIIPIVILFSAFSISAHSLSIELDGVTNERLWLDAETQILASERDSSNSGVSFAVASFFYDEPSNRVYISFKVNTESVAQEQSLYSIQINPDNHGFIAVSKDSIGEYDELLYYIDAGLSELSQGSYCVELCLGAKLGLKSLSSVSVRFADANGVYSNVYQLKLPDLPSEETTTAFADETTLTSATSTTANNTTRITTTTGTTTKRTEKTTAEKTAKEKTTKPETTAKPKTAKQSTTARIVTVYVTVTNEADNVIYDTVPPEATAQATTLVAEETENDYRELKYAALAGLVILIFGLCVIINMNNDKQKK